MNALLTLNLSPLFEGNRAYDRKPLPIEERDRTADGTLRVDRTATKEIFTISWTHLPASNIGDALGRDSLVALYKIGGKYPLRVSEPGNSYTDHVVCFSNYQERLVWRNAAGWVYAVSITLEEV